MSYTKIIEGQTLPPGSTFPDHCYFKNCTIQATCSFGKASLFDSCTFQKCCPKHYSNEPSKVIDSIVINSTLESVHLNSGTLGVNNKSTGYKVIDESYTREGTQLGQASATKWDKWQYNCCEAGQSLSPDGTTAPVTSCKPCEQTRVFKKEK